jgi:hypothetical protein
MLINYIFKKIINNKYINLKKEFKIKKKSIINLLNL